MRGARCPRSRGTTSSRFSGPDLAALAVLLAAPGADAFFDGDASVSVSSGLSWTSRLNAYAVSQAAGSAQPTVGSASPTGRLSVLFAASGSQFAGSSDGVLAGLYDGTQAYSSLIVWRSQALGTRTFWSVGDSTSSQNYVAEMTVNNGDRRIRRSAAGFTNNDSTAVYANSVMNMTTTVFTGSDYSVWANGVATTIAAAANRRTPVCARLDLGARRAAGVMETFLNAELFGVIIARAQWSTQERQDIETAARAYWGITA